jgi:hypothetical protein
MKLFLPSPSPPPTEKKTELNAESVKSVKNMGRKLLKNCPVAILFACLRTVLKSSYKAMFSVYISVFSGVCRVYSDESL